MALSTVSVFGVNLTKHSQTTQFVVLASGALFCSLGFAFLQEKVTRVEGFSHYDLMTFLTTFSFAICGNLERYLSGDTKRKASMKDYFLLSLCTLGGMYLTNYSLTYLNYTTRIVFKSSKVIPVMLVGVLMQGKKYIALEYISMIVLVVGIVFFTLGDANESPTYSPIGLMLISGGVILDAITANYEEKHLFHKLKCSPAEVMTFASLYGALFSFVGLILKNDPTLPEYVIEHPEVVYLSAGFSVLGYCSSLFILMLIKHFGATNAEIVKSLRKILSVAISFVAFAKPFSSFHLYGTLLFVASTLIGIKVKDQKAKLKRYESVSQKEVEKSKSASKKQD